MIFFGVAFVLAILAGIQLGRSLSLLAAAASAFVVFFLGLLIAYLETPSLVGPFWGLGGLGLMAMIIGAVIQSLGDDEGGPSRAQVTMISLAGGFLFVRMCASDGCVQADRLHAMIGTVKNRQWSDDLAPVSKSHIREVSLAHAQVIGNRALGEVTGAIGSQFQVGEYTIQRVKGELYWVAPLDFRDFWKWRNTLGTGSPGYVMVSAEDQNRTPQLITTVNSEALHMKYMTSACFGDNLERYLYTHGYSGYNLVDPSFEIDEDLRPFWVVTLTEPTLHYTGEKVVGAVAVDAQTGAIMPIALDAVPDWVDRIMPDDVVKNYVTWWGEYIDGWWNSTTWGGEKGLLKPSGPMQLVWGEDGEPWWFVGMTSSSNTDQALNGFMLFHTRNSKARYYELTGFSGHNESAIESQVNSTVSNFSGYHATEGQIYNVMGHLAWVVPVDGSDNRLHRVAIAQVSTGKVSLGNDKQDALRQFQLDVMHSTDAVSPASLANQRQQRIIVGRVGRDVQSGSTVYYLYDLATPQRIYTATVGLSAQLPLTEVGDTVDVTFLETVDPVVSLMRFENPSLPLRKSPAQAAVEARSAAAQLDAAGRQVDRSIEGQVNYLSPEEKAELAAQLKAIRARKAGQ